MAAPKNAQTATPHTPQRIKHATPRSEKPVWLSPSVAGELRRAHGWERGAAISSALTAVGSAGRSGTGSLVRAVHGWANGLSHCVAGSSVPKVMPITPQTSTVRKIPTAPRIRARAAIARRNARTMLSQGNTSDHATARIVGLLLSAMSGVPQEKVPRSNQFPALYGWQRATQ